MEELGSPRALRFADNFFPDLVMEEELGSPQALSFADNLFPDLVMEELGSPPSNHLTTSPSCIWILDPRMTYHCIE
jgi:hypothetical protein